MRYDQQKWSVISSLCLLITGISLLSSILFKLPLLIVLSVLFIGALTWFLIFLPKAPDSIRFKVLHRLKIGLITGVIATITYDVVRYDMVKILNLGLNPFKAFPHFGFLLANGKGSQSLHWVLGSIYHFANGLGFAASYSILLAHRGWIPGVIWALCLEAFTIGLYPGWLNFAFTPNFLWMSLTGHIAYGMILGIMCQKLDKKIFQKNDLSN